jgi:hypothetical protein
MGRLIVSAQMTADCVLDPIEEWFDATLEEGDGVAQDLPGAGRSRTTRMHS